MKTKMLKTMLALAALALAIGDVQAKIAAQPKAGTLIVYRPGSPVGCLRSYSFSIDNRPRYKLTNGRYMRFELPAGDHSVKHPFDWTLNFGSDTQRVHITAGQTVYFQYVIHPMMGMVFEASDDQAQAKETASGCKLQEVK